MESLGRAGRFDELREILQSLGYTEPAICGRLGIARLSDFELEPLLRPALPEPADALDVLIRLFLAGEEIPAVTASDLLRPHVAGLLSDMGLLATSNRGCYGSVALYPVRGLLVASDRWSNPDKSAFEAPPDTVYPALVPNTQLFLDLLPSDACEACLDLGSGTGIAALFAAQKGASQAWAADIAERSTQFALFNARLNALTNVHPLTSDLYLQVPEGTYDRIVAHPPYVPSLSPKWVFLSGGEDGEQITRRIIEGLPHRLRPNGLCCLLTMGSDRGGHSFESRIREWLGREQAGFDIVLLVRRYIEPRQFALQSSRLEPRPRAEARAFLELFARLDVTTMAYGFILIRRRADNTGAPITVRREASPHPCCADWQWLLAWESAAQGDRLIPLVLNSRLHRSRGTSFAVTHKLTEDGWRPQEYRLHLDRPFPVDCAVEPWAAHLIARCDGRLTGREILAALQQDGAIPQRASAEEFASAMQPLVSGGFVEVEGFRPPRPEE